MIYNKKGFTLVELIIAITLISFISMAIFFAMDPFMLFKKSRNAARDVHIENIKLALARYESHNIGMVPDCMDEYYFANLSECAGLVPGHLPKEPKDPQGYDYNIGWANEKRLDFCVYSTAPEWLREREEYLEDCYFPLWSTSFDCAEWGQGTAPNCDGLSAGGGWTCNPGSYGGQITTAASNPLSEGSRGYRYWKGDGINNNSGGIVLDLESPQPEIWIRWYHRHEAGFKWMGGSTQSDRLIDVRTNHNSVIPISPYYSNRYRLTTSSPSAGYLGVSGISWEYIMGGLESDGEFHLYETYMKMDTDGTDGIAKSWIDGELVIEHYNVNYSGGSDSERDQEVREGWTRIVVGSGQHEPDNGRCMAGDYDDIVVFARDPLRLDSRDNLWIGAIK